MEGQLPTDALPAIWADMNAQGWAGAGDNAFYALDSTALAAAKPEHGKRVFLWEEDEAGTILGWIAVLEYASIGEFTGWRALPVAGSFYRGPSPRLCRVGSGPNSSFKPNPLRGSA